VPSDSDDENEDPSPAKRLKNARIPARGRNIEERTIVRKQTGPPKRHDDESSGIERDEPLVKLETGGRDASERNIVRRPTGFVLQSEIPSSDDDEECNTQSNAQVKLETGGRDASEATVVRKGTGFVLQSEIPSSDDDEECNTQSTSVVKLETGGRDASEARVVRKGTGFVLQSDIPSSDDDEECNTESTSFMKLETGGRDASEATVVRKGTGFILQGEFPSSSEEDVDDLGHEFNTTTQQSKIADDEHVHAAADSQAEHLRSGSPSSLASSVSLCSSRQGSSTSESDEDVHRSCIASIFNSVLAVDIHDMAEELAAIF